MTPFHVEGGFLYVDDILKLPKMKGRTVEDVQRVVLENDKQRFFMERHSENGQLKIRANQGHTMKVSHDLLLPFVVNNLIWDMCSR